MHGFAAAMATFVLLAVPLGVAGTASALPWEDRDLTTEVLVGARTDRFDGGGFVGVRAGETLFGVRYGTEDRPNNLVIFAEYKRYLGGADIVDAQGNLLQTRGLPIYTVLGQSLEGFIEFYDRDDNGLLNFHSLENRTLDNRTLDSGDRPVKALRLATAWTLDGPEVADAAGVTYVNFTLSAANLTYMIVSNGTRQPAPVEAGVLDRVAFTFRLEVHLVESSATIPWYRITVDTTTGREITNVTRLEPRDVSGTAVEMRAKYDHDIRGWDFVNASSQIRLALETHMLFGNFIPSHVARIVHLAYYHDRAETNATADGRYFHDESTEEPVAPIRFTWDSITFADEWHRVGRFVWESGVMVDGRPDVMTFQVQGGGRLFLYREGAIFSGFRIRGAFIYPNGQAIFHDPGMEVTSLVPDVVGAVNLTPLTILAVQLGLVAIATGPALYLRAKAKARRSK